LKPQFIKKLISSKFKDLIIISSNHKIIQFITITNNQKVKKIKGNQNNFKIGLTVKLRIHKINQPIKNNFHHQEYVIQGKK